MSHLFLQTPVTEQSSTENSLSTFWGEPHCHYHLPVTQTLLSHLPGHIAPGLCCSLSIYSIQYGHNWHLYSPLQLNACICPSYWYAFLTFPNENELSCISLFTKVLHLLTELGCFSNTTTVCKQGLNMVILQYQ